MMKRFLSVLIAIIMVLSLAGCAQTAKVAETTLQTAEETTAEETTAKETEAETAETIAETEKETEAVTEAETADAAEDADAESAHPQSDKTLFKIVYTNDIHSYVYNTAKDADGNETPALRLSNVAAYIDDLKAAGENVIVVDDGDLAAGSVYGSYDNGKTIIELAKLMGYQAITLGNHDCDFGTTVFRDWVVEDGMPFISCNFKSVKTKKCTLPPYIVVDAGGTKVALVGISSPNTIASSTPTFYQDEDGNFLFYVEGSDDRQDLFDCVQETVDMARKEADYVIAMGHVGVDTLDVAAKKTSRDIIENTTGIDAFIDGHSHTVMIGETVKNKDGDPIILTQTGCYLGAFGVMTVTESGNVTTELLTGYDKADEKIAALEEQLKKNVDEEYNVVIARNKDKLYINNPENHDERFIRAMEMNSGDFSADSYYWYFNERKGLDCDACILNAGAIRSDVEEGEVTLGDIKSLSPFGNQVCLVKVTGQNILDALECGVTVTGEFDDQWNIPAENGGFMHVAGLKYSVDASVPSSVVRDSEGMFVKVDGDYRVHDVQIYDKKSGKYVPMDINETYTLGGISYILRNSGDGLSMFKDSEMITDFVGEDYLIMAEYAKHFKDEGEGDGVPYICAKNSDLSSYKGYLIDYENPYGSGRITIENVDYNK